MKKIIVDVLLKLFTKKNKVLLYDEHGWFVKTIR